MSLKHALILLTLVSVVADTMLLPFYPQFFAQSFGMHAPEHVGYYIAACCFTVMTAFPLWAKVAKKINELHLWIYTQLIAGALGIACYYSTSLVEFWVLSQLMLVFKASYLLIYPFVIRLEEKDKHLGMISLFSVLMHFGAIGGALLGGMILQVFDPRDVYLVMPASDAIQILVCVFIIAKLKTPFRAEPESEHAIAHRTPEHKRFIAHLGLVSMLFYFSVFLIRPFFSRYWESISQLQGEMISGLIYSIPGWVALFGLWMNHKARSSGNNGQHIAAAMLFGIAGLLLQGAQHEALVVVGRCVFGWGLFQATVRLEVMMFENSTPENYARDFSRVHFFQNLGVIGASFAVGHIVDNAELVTPFFVAMAGLSITLAYFVAVFKRKLMAAPQAQEA